MEKRLHKISDKFLESVQKDFAFLVRAIWACINLPEPSLVQKDISHWLQTGPRLRGVKAFRGATKTWITTAYCVWRLYNNPDLNIILAYASIEPARETLHMAKQWVRKIPFLKHMTPSRLRGEAQRESSTRFDVGQAEVDRSPSIKAVGVTGQLPSHRADLIIADDLETNENSITPENRAALRKRFNEFISILKPGGEIVVLGTPYHQDSLYYSLADSGFTFRSWPIRYPTADQIGRIPDLAPLIKSRLADNPGIAGTPTWPELFSKDEILLKERSVSRDRLSQYYFDMQYMLMRVDAQDFAYRIRLEDLIVHEVNVDKAPVTIAWGKKTGSGSTAIDDRDMAVCSLPGDGFYAPIMIDDEWRPYEVTKMFVDPSGGIGKDETAWAIIGVLNGNLFVKSIGAYEGGHTPSNMDKIAFDASTYKVNELIIESNFGGSMLQQLLMPRLARLFDQGKWSCSVSLFPNKGRKQDRILDTISGPIKAHRVIIPPRVAQDREFCHQLTHLTREKDSIEKDDRVDAFASCISQLSDFLCNDAYTFNTFKSRQEEQETINKYLASLGIKRQLSWINF